MTRPALARRLLLLLCALAAAAAPAAARSKLDPRLRLVRAASPQRRLALAQSVAVQTSGPQPSADVFIKVAPGTHRADLQRAYPGAVFRSEIGGVVTARVPLSLLAGFETDPRILQVQAGRKLHPTLDIVRSNTLTGASPTLYLGVLQNPANQDLDSPGAALDGTGVVVGDVDTGIDWSHPDFVTGSNTSRILDIWDQTDSGGPNPSLYAFGTEWTRTDINNALKSAGTVREQDTDGHGTHVSGIMASDGRAGSGLFTGMAKNADIVMVKTDFTDTDIIDGVRYIIDRAAASGERAVINLSLGSQVGPHDGTDLFEQPLGVIAASTPVFVAAGNDQDFFPHAHHTGGGDTSFDLDCSSSTAQQLDVDYWTPGADGYTVTVTLLDDTGTPFSGSVSATNGNDATGSITIPGQGTATVNIYNADSANSNGDNEIFVDVNDPTLSVFYVHYDFTRTSSGGSGVIDGYSGGDGDGTGWWLGHSSNIVSWGSVSEPGTALNVFTVGSYVSKTQWIASDNNTYTYTDGSQLGYISPFSNTGPSRDGRQEPEFAAPGQGVASALSSASSPDAATIMPDTKHFVDQGTSMATPVGTGWAALALQVSTAATVAQLHALLDQSGTRSDSQVTAAGAVPNGTWGYGKLKVNLKLQSAVTGLAAAGTTATSAQWTWSPVYQATAYHVYNAASPSSLLASVASPSFTWSSLASDASFDVIVKPYNPAGEGPQTTAPSQTTLAPAISGSPGITVYSSSVTVTYTSCGSSCNGYTLQISTAASFFNPTTVTTGNTGLTSLSATGLSGSTLYYLRLGTLNSVGAINYTSLGTVSTAAPYLQPGAAAFSGVTSGQIQANWTSGGNGAGITYVVEASPSSGFTGTVFSAQGVDLFSKLFTSLAPNTSYYFSVVAGPGSPTLLEGPQTTLAAAPVSAAAASVGSTSAAFAWQSAGNPSDTDYVAELSADGFSSVLASSRTLGLSASFSGLSPNTTYYGRVEALGRGGDVSAFTTVFATATDVAAPASPAVAAHAATSLTLSWSSNGDGAGTRYLAQALDPSSAVAASSLTLNTQAVLSGLTPNTTYTLRVEAIGSGGGASAFVQAAAFASDPVAPAGAGVSGLTTSALAAAWTSNGNGAGTLYEASLSTDDFVSVSAITKTTALSATYSSLSANTTYWVRVRADGFNGADSAQTVLGSGTTLATPPASLAVGGVSATGLSLSWAATDAPGTPYEAQLSADGFATVLAASDTANTSASFSGLTANTTYFLRVQAFNWAGSSTAFSAAVTTATLPAPPAGGTFSGVTASALTASWLTGGNAAATTRYTARISTDNFATVNASLETTALSASFSGLLSNTTYWLQARADGHDGQESAFAALGSTITLLQPPAAPASPLSAPGASSVLAQWLSGGNGPATTYTAQISADGFGTVLASSSTLNLSALFGAGGQGAALSPNTPYALRVRASGAGGNSSAFVGLGSVYTLAKPPTGTTFAAVLASSATLSWSLDGNPAGTTAEVQRSQDGVTYASSAALTGTSYVDTTLLGCTTYYYRVRDRNGDGLATSFDGVVSFVTSNTVPSPAIGLEADPLPGNRVSLAWTPSPTEGISAYRLYYDGGTGAVSFSSPFVVLSSTATSYTSGVLVSSAAYTFALRAVHRCGVEETTGVYASAASTSVLSGVRAVIRAPDSGKRVKGDHVSLVAELASGTPDQAAQVTFQYLPPGGGAWLDVPAAGVEHPNPDPDYPYVIQWDADADAHGPGTYQLRAVAVDLKGSSDTAPAASIISVVPGGADYDISETLRADGKIEKDQIIDNAVANTVIGGGASTTDPLVKVLLPSGVVGSSTVTVSVVSNPVIPSTTSPAGFIQVGSALQVTLSNGQTSLGGAAQLTLSFPESASLDRDLEIQSYDPLTGAWSTIGPASVDTANRTVTAATPHFSLFAVVAESAGADLGGVRVYPNPYKPNGGDPMEGRPYSPGDVDSGIVFDHLPVGATVRIYTISGRLVAKLDEAGSGGAVPWDARNGDGRDAASGGYIAVISAPGLKSVVKKVVILR